MATYTMRGQTYEFKQAENEEEANRLYWLMTASHNPTYRQVAKRFYEMGIEMQVSDVRSITLEQATTERFSNVSLIARQVLNRRGIQYSAQSVEFPAGTQKLIERGEETLVTYTLLDGKSFEAFDGELNFKRK